MFLFTFGHGGCSIWSALGSRKLLSRVPYLLLKLLRTLNLHPLPNMPWSSPYQKPNPRTTQLGLQTQIQPSIPINQRSLYVQISHLLIFIHFTSDPPATDFRTVGQSILYLWNNNPRVSHHNWRLLSNLKGSTLDPWNTITRG